MQRGQEKREARKTRGIKDNYSIEERVGEGRERESGPAISTFLLS
jgi:hypothetical protein